MKKQKKPLVSAIITTHNREKLLKKAIDSVLRQSYSNIECIVVDDASDQSIKKHLEEYAKVKKIRYIYIPKNESKGGNHARNIGIKASKGEYIAFLDDDDEWYPDKIQLQVNEISKNIGFIYTGTVIENNGKVLNDNPVYYNCPEGDLSKEILIRILTVTSTILVKRDVLYEAGLFDEELKYWQEYDLCIRLLQLTEVKFINKGLVLYRVNTADNSRLSNKVTGWEESVQYIDRKYATLLNRLSKKERAKRNLYVCIDGFSRGKKAKSYKYMLKYGFIYPISHPATMLELFKKIINRIKRKVKDGEE